MLQHRVTHIYICIIYTCCNIVSLTSIYMLQHHTTHPYIYIIVSLTYIYTSPYHLPIYIHHCITRLYIFIYFRLYLCCSTVSLTCIYMLQHHSPIYIYIYCIYVLLHRVAQLIYLLQHHITQLYIHISPYHLPICILTSLCIYTYIRISRDIHVATPCHSLVCTCCSTVSHSPTYIYHQIAYLNMYTAPCHSPVYTHCSTISLTYIYIHVIYTCHLLHCITHLAVLVGAHKLKELGLLHIDLLHLLSFPSRARLQGVQSLAVCRGRLQLLIVRVAVHSVVRLVKLPTI